MELIKTSVKWETKLNFDSHFQVSDVGRLDERVTFPPSTARDVTEDVTSWAETGARKYSYCSSERVIVD